VNRLECSLLAGMRNALYQFKVSKVSIRVRLVRASSRVKVRIRVKVRVSVMVRVSIRTSWVVNFAIFRCYQPVIYTRPK